MKESPPDHALYLSTTFLSTFSALQQRLVVFFTKALQQSGLHLDRFLLFHAIKHALEELATVEAMKPKYNI